MHCVPTAENHKVWIQGYTAGTHITTDVVTGMGCAWPVYRHCCIESTQFHLLVIYGQDITDTQPISPDHFYLTTLLSLYWHGLDTLLPAISLGCLQILCLQWLSSPICFRLVWILWHPGMFHTILVMKSWSGSGSQAPPTKVSGSQQWMHGMHSFQLPSEDILLGTQSACQQMGIS